MKNHIRWFYLIFSQTRGMAASSILFYGTSLMILISIPVTVVLLQTEKDAVTRASSNPANYSNPPSSTIELPTAVAQSGDSVEIKVIATNTNWSVLYFSSTFPTVRIPSGEENMTIVAQGAHIANAHYSSKSSGYFMLVNYQLTGLYGEFQTGDVMCSWDGGMYIYKNKDSNPISGFLNSRQPNSGVWEYLTSCQNSGVKQLTIR